MKTTAKILAFISFITIISSVAGIYAQWQYITISQQSYSASLDLAAFAYAPEEVLPDTPEDTQLGTNHMSLLEAIKTDSKLGLNINKKNNLEDALVSKKGFVHCYDNTINGGNMNNLTEPSRSLAYVLECTVKNDEIVGDIYLYSFDIMSSRPANDTPIIVYRTTLTYQNNKWQETVSFEGYVLSSNTAVLSGKNGYYIRPEYWISGHPHTA